MYIGSTGNPNERLFLYRGVASVVHAVYENNSPICWAGIDNATKQPYVGVTVEQAADQFKKWVISYETMQQKAWHPEKDKPQEGILSNEKDRLLLLLIWSILGGLGWQHKKEENS